MDQYEKAIREKVFAAKILSDGEWVYLVGLFGMARDHGELVEENERIRNVLARYRDETPLGHQPHMIAHEADIALGRQR